MVINPPFPSLTAYPSNHADDANDGSAKTQLEVDTRSDGPRNQMSPPSVTDSADTSP